ncbi:hypothetical protein QL285_097501 [Trifolium repens]|nr:hypothetical protein QL285_098124 [Trifolium repens]KAK2351215.1 hypothetical protein QL285_097501 [Trifolium repens]
MLAPLHSLIPSTGEEVQSIGEVETSEGLERLIRERRKQNSSPNRSSRGSRPNRLSTSSTYSTRGPRILLLIPLEPTIVFRIKLPILLVQTLKDQLTLDRKGFRSRSSRTCSEVSLGFGWCSDIPNRGGSKLRGVGLLSTDMSSLPFLYSWSTRLSQLARGWKGRSLEARKNEPLNSSILTSFTDYRLAIVKKSEA